MFKTKMASLLFIISICTWSSAADTTDELAKISSQQDSIQKHLNQVEVKLDKVLIELSNRSAVEAVKNLTKTWGKGTSFGINASSFQMIEADLGYSFYKGNRSTRSVHISYNQRLQLSCINQGASNFLEKPVSLPRLLT